MFKRLSSLLIFIEAVAISAAVRFTLSFLPASFRLHWMGKPVSVDYTPIEISSELQVALLKVKMAVARCNRYAPWNTECLTQALTAKWMLEKRQISSLLIIGFRKDADGEIAGHAWLKAEDYFITGYRPDLEDYVINGRFGSQLNS